MPKENWQKLPICHKEAEKLDIILVCDGTVSVGQVGHKASVKLTRDMPEQTRMCCFAAQLPQDQNCMLSLHRRQKGLLL